MTNIDLPKGITLHRGKLRIAFRPPGKSAQLKRSLGIPPTKANIVAAEQMLNAIRRDISLGKFDLAEYFPNDPSLKASKYTLRELLEEYFIAPRVTRVKGSSLNIYMSAKDSLIELLGNIDVVNLTEENVRRLGTRIRNYKAGKDRRNRFLWLLRDAGKRAEAAGKLDKNPFSILLPIEEVNSDRLGQEAELDRLSVYTIDEAERIVNACKRENTKRLLTFLFWSGVRPGEAAALRREDVCLPYIVVRSTLTQRATRQTPKTGRARKIYLASSARLALEQQLQTHDFETVWTNAWDRPIIRSNSLISDAYWKSILAKAGVRFLVLYSTRHSFASWMLAAGESEMTVANHLGHVDVSMVRKVYGQFIPENEPEWTLDDPAKIEALKKSMKSVG